MKSSRERPHIPGLFLVILLGCLVGYGCCFSQPRETIFAVSRHRRVILSTGERSFHKPDLSYAAAFTSPSSLTKCNQKPISVALNMQSWDGDDVRWSSKMRRRLRRSELVLDRNYCKTSLILVNIVLYIYQFLTTVEYLRRKYPSYWPNNAMDIVLDAIWGTSMLGPLSRSFGFSAALSHSQPFRYLTSGFFHSGFIPLIVNIDTLRRQPSWLETGLGTGLYLTTFLVSIAVGNMTQILSVASVWDPTVSLGASSGVAGLFGLMFICLTKMGNFGCGAGVFFRGMGTLLLLGMWVDYVSTPAIVGGFFSGVFTGMLCGPRYVTDYAMKRKNSVEFDPAPRDYRRAMGFGVAPTRGGILSLKLFWGIVVVALLSDPKFRLMPSSVTRALLHPLQPF
jgi:membrane associated rhomboid family serine protease